MLQLSSVPATPYVEQLSIGVGRRTLAISLAVLIPAILLLLLLVFGSETPPDNRRELVSVVSLKATEMPERAPEPSSPKRERSEEPSMSPQRAPKEPLPSKPAQPLPPQAAEPKPAPTTASPESPRIGVRQPGGQVYGPPDKGRSSSSRDSERVGTAPNGEPLYAAAWYREPREDELRGFLSTASGPGWGMIACRTAPDYRVEDCVGLGEYPNGSKIEGAVLAASWQFRVRPARIGGRPMVGSWVRIRIDYRIERR